MVHPPSPLPPPPPENKREERGQSWMIIASNVNLKYKNLLYDIIVITNFNQIYYTQK